MCRRPFLFLAAFALLMCLTVVASAQASPRDTGNSIVILGTNASSSCSNVMVDFFLSHDEPIYLVVTLVSQGHIVTDAQYAATTPNTMTGSISTGYHNYSGRAPVNMWPLMPDKKVYWYLTLHTQDWEPLYEARAMAKSCDVSALKWTSHGPAFQLVENQGFEVAIPGDAFDPAYWMRTNAVNDARVCDPVRAGSSVYSGDCGFLFIAEDGTTTKGKQKYSGTIGKAGDQIVLNTFIQSSTGYSGGAKVKAVLRFANGATHQLVVSAAPGQHLYGPFPTGFPHTDAFEMPAPLISAVVTLQQKNGTGNVAFDNVTLTVFSSGGPEPRALAAPASPGH